MNKINIPLSVPPKNRWEYAKNFQLATKKTGRLMLFAADQKIEHLNDDFYGPGIAAADATAEHFFQIAAAAPIGVLASQLGLVAAYADAYRKIPYLIKLNAKTNLIPTAQQDPRSRLLNTVEQVVKFKRHSRLSIVGVGYTLYPGSAAESQMLAEAAQVVYQAHYHGLLAVLWIYPRGRAVTDGTNPHLLAGMAGLGASLGADFVKLPTTKNLSKEQCQEIVSAAGLSGVIFSGGASVSPKKFLETLAAQIKYGARGNATGRNIHQKEPAEAIRFCQALAAVSLYDYSAAAAYRIYLGKEKFKK